MYGFYSAKQALIGGVCEYKTPDGSLVKTTEICRSNKPFGAWDDYIAVGEVVSCVRQLLKGEIERLFDEVEDTQDYWDPKQIRRVSVIEELSPGSIKLQKGDVWN